MTAPAATARGSQTYQRSLYFAVTTSSHRTGMFTWPTPKTIRASKQITKRLSPEALAYPSNAERKET